MSSVLIIEFDEPQTFEDGDSYQVEWNQVGPRVFKDGEELACTWQSYNVDK